MMSQRERVVVSRLYRAISGVPLPARGSQSTTITGLSGYALDMEEVLRGCVQVHDAIMDGNLAEAERLLDRIDAWREERKRDDWVSKRTHIDLYGTTEAL